MKKNKNNLKVNNIITAFLVFVILCIINIISYKFFFHIDITDSMLNSLADSSIKVLEKVDSQLKIYAFYKKGSREYEQARKILEEYSIANKNVEVFFGDIDKDPEKAIELGVKNEMIVLLYKNKRENCYSTQEDKITQSIYKMVSEDKINIYFLQGHGERQIDTYENNSYTKIADVLKKSAFKVKPLFLSESETIPEDCDILIIAGAKKSLLQNELEEIKKYFDNSGKLFILLDPSIEGGNSLRELVNYTGYDVKDGIILDFGSNLNRDVRTPAIKEYEHHFISEKLSQTFFPFSRAIFELKKKSSGEFYIKDIIKTIKGKSYTIKQPNRQDLVSFDVNKAVYGNQTILGISNKTHIYSDQGMKVIDGRAVISGDSSFASDQFVELMGNGDLFFNAINWLSADKDILSINFMDGSSRRFISLTNIAKKKIFFITVIIIPVLIVMMGILVVIRRERE